MALLVTILTGCVSGPNDVSLAELPSLGLDFATGAGVNVQLRYNTSAIEPCAALAADVTATFDGVPMTVRRGGGETEECLEPSLYGTFLPQAEAHTLVIEDPTRTITLDLGDRLTPREVTKVPAGPLDLVAGETYTFRTNVPADLERGLNVALRGGTEILLLPPSRRAGGEFEVTMPVRSFDGTFDAWTGAQGLERTSIGGVSCLFPTSSHFTSQQVALRLP